MNIISSKGDVMKLKKSIGKNQVIITALAVMIAVAGYINYSDNIRNRNKSTKNTT